MKKKALLAKLACATVLLSPIVLTGCQAIDGLFGDSTGYDNSKSYGRQDHRSSAGVSSSSTSKAITSTYRNTSTASVPVEPPSVHNESSTNSTAASTENTASASHTASVKVPVTPATDMIAPTVEQ